MKVIVRRLLLCSAASLFLNAFQLDRVFALQVQSSSMEPTISKGQWIVVSPLADPAALAVGDIVVVDVPALDGARLVKRVVAVAGDSIGIRDKRLSRNGMPVDEPYAEFRDGRIFVEGDDPAFVERDQLEPVSIGRAEVFVLGDNRDYSHDSRFFGALRVSSVVGRVE